jgi:pyridoxal phosphate enzyme (YggS family)
VNVAERLISLKREVPGHIKIIAVSKNHPAGSVMEAYHAGHRQFGENKVQEIAKKIEVLPKDIEWHFIGHLQSNKVKYIAPFIHYIHSVDSLGLLMEINRQAQKSNRIIRCLLQFHIAREESKFGLTMDEAIEMVDSSQFDILHNIIISGVMGMATFTDDNSLIRKEFADLYRMFTLLKQSTFRSSAEFKELSMGMSGDYQVAISEGSTMIRIGTTIFGAR